MILNPEPWAPVPGLRVAETAVGLGVFATHEFAAGVTVAVITGELIHCPDYEGSETAIDLQDQGTLEPAAPFRFLNHSCAPNCGLVLHAEEDEDGELLQESLLLETLRPVATGEQLTIDYGWAAEAAIPCHCGSATCRLWVVAESELSRVGHCE